MSTRSLVGYENDNGFITFVYVHFDGYLSGVGAELKQYTTKVEVDDLISYGDRSALQGPYYDEEPQVASSRNSYLLSSRGVDFVYLFTKEGEWEVCDRNKNSRIFVSY